MKLATQFLSIVLSALLISGTLSAQVETGLQIKLLDNNTASGLAVEVADATGAPVADAAVLFRLPDTGPTATFADGTHAAVAYTDQSGRATVNDLRWSSEAGSSTIRITATRGASRGGILIEHQVGSPQPVLPAKPEPVVIANPQPPTASVPVARSQPEVTKPQPGIPEAKTLPKPELSADASMPRVSVSSAPANERIHGGISKKWLILAIVAAGAGAGVAIVGKGKSGSSSTTSTTGVSIGTPTISVGQP